MPHHGTKQYQLEYCFTREKQLVFAEQKQSIPMSIHDFAERTILLCLICFPLMQKFKQPAKNWQENSFLKECQMTVYYTLGQKFCRNHSISHCFQDKYVCVFYAENQDGCQKWQENDFGKEWQTTL